MEDTERASAAEAHFSNLLRKEMESALAVLEDEVGNLRRYLSWQPRQGGHSATLCLGNVVTIAHDRAKIIAKLMGRLEQIQTGIEG